MSGEQKQLLPFDSSSESDSMLSYARADSRGGNIFSKLHATMRGRYWFVLPLALMLGLAGAYGGYKAVSPLYESEGAIQILPFVQAPTVGANNSEIKDYDDWMQTQALFVSSSQIINSAMQGKIWASTFRPLGPEQFRLFKKNLLVDHPGHTQIISIRYTDTDPLVASRGVSAVIAAFQSYYEQNLKATNQHNLGVIDETISDISQQISADRDKITQITREVAGAADFNTVYGLAVARNDMLKKRLDDVQLALKISEDAPPAEQVIDKMTTNQIGLLDELMAKKLERLEEMQLDLRHTANAMGEKHPKYIDMQAQYEDLKKDIDTYAETWRNMQKAKSSAPLDPNTHGANIGWEMLFKNHEVFAKEERVLFNQFQDEDRKLKELGQKLNDIENAQSDLNDRKASLDRENSLKADIVRMSKTAQRLIVISDGDVNWIPSKDHRLIMALIGGMMGIGLPMLLAGGLSVYHRRYRYSDEAEGKAGEPPLLGILPTLPDHLADPEQAAVAAHCIHQIRIMLQVGARQTANGQDPKRVFMITSANTGDGKTSLAMALALSFSAAGSRTLVVDCDMVGQGLTYRLRAMQSQGLYEALTHGSIKGRVKRTTTSNLYVLPIGGCEAVHAGALSPTSIKRVLQEARSIFDIVIVDTGPILGSLEASVVVTAVDSVILAVSRGQSQVLFHKAVRHLRAVGATVTGVVFNRAEKRDFNRSVGSASVRSQSYQPVAPRMLVSEGDESARFGPLARSVASFIPGINSGRSNGNGNAKAAEGNGNGNGNGNGGVHSSDAADSPPPPSAPQ